MDKMYILLLFLLISVVYIHCGITSTFPFKNGSKSVGPFYIQHTKNREVDVTCCDYTQCIQQCMADRCCRAGQIQEATGDCTLSYVYNTSMDFVKQIPNNGHCLTRGEHAKLLFL